LRQYGLVLKPDCEGGCHCGHHKNPVAIWTLLLPPCFLFKFICIRPSLLAVKYRVALYVNPVVGFRRDVAAEAVLLVVSRDLLVRCIGFK
jgi:hypothetical protein